MAKSKALSREQVVDAAYALACEQGLAGVGIRTVATACGVATGTIYNYFPAKADLVYAVVGRFWREEMGGAMELAASDGSTDSAVLDYVDFCGRLYEDTREALGRFRREWLPQVAGITGGAGMAACPEAMQALAHMREGLVRVIENDPRIVRERLVGTLAPRCVAALTLRCVMSLAEGEGLQSCDVGSRPHADVPGGFGAAVAFESFCSLLRLALY